MPRSFRVRSVAAVFDSLVASVSSVIRLSVVAGSVLLGTSVGHAAGPYIADIDPVALGQGGAFVASPSTTSAIYYNPAGLAGQTGLRLQVEFGFSASQMAFKRASEGAVNYPTLSNQDPLQPAFFAGASYDFGVPGLAVSMAAWTPMSNQFAYSDAGPQRYQYIRADNIVMQMHLGAAYQIFRWLSVGASVGNTYFATKQRLAVSAALVGDVEDPGFSTPLQLDVTDPFTITSNFGVRVTPTDFLDIGLSFAPPYDVQASGKAGVELPTNLASLVSVQGDKVQLNLNLPFIFRAGVRAKVHERVSIEAATIWEGWSRYQKVEVVPSIALNVAGSALPLPTISLTKRYRDSVAVRLGGEVRALDWLTGRAGAWIETSATRPEFFDLSTPDAFKVGFGVGVSARVWDGIFLDATYAHLFPQVVNVTNTQLLVQSLVPGSNAAPKPMGNGRYDFNSALFHFGVRVALFDAPKAPSPNDSPVTPNTEVSAPNADTRTAPPVAAEPPPAAEPTSPSAEPSTTTPAP